MKMTPKQLRASLRKEAQAINERNRVPGDPHYKEPIKTRTDYLNDLTAQGFATVEDGGDAVIVIGQREQIPTDRLFSVFDLMTPTRARRFESAKEAVRVLIPSKVS